MLLVHSAVLLLYSVGQSKYGRVACINTEPTPTSSLQTCGSNGNATSTTPGICVSQDYDRQIPTAWPTLEAQQHGRDPYLSLTRPDQVPRFKDAQLRFFPQEGPSFSNAKQTIIHYLDVEITRLQRMRSKNILTWPWRSRKAYFPDFSRIVGDPRRQHLSVEFDSKGPLDPIMQITHVTYGQALPLLLFFRRCVHDWGVHRARVDVYDGKGPQYPHASPRYLATFQIKHLGPSSAPGSSSGIAVSENSTDVGLLGCQNNGTSAWNETSSCATAIMPKRALPSKVILKNGEENPHHIPMPTAWPVLRPYNPHQPFDEYRWPTRPGSVPGYPQAELRFRRTSPIPMSLRETAGIHEALDHEISKLESLRTRNKLTWRIRAGRQRFENFAHMCGNTMIVHSVIGLTDKLSSNFPGSRAKKLNNIQALALLRWFRWRLGMERKLGQWGTHTVNVEIWERFGERDRNNRFHMATFVIGKEEPHQAGGNQRMPAIPEVEPSEDVHAAEPGGLVRVENAINETAVLRRGGRFWIGR